MLGAQGLERRAAAARRASRLSSVYPRGLVAEPLELPPQLEEEPQEEEEAPAAG